ncbi:P-loop containing nucleoside triphosphate hydrolase protein [Rhypophila decipiens]|uniref:P-loop containing nucleoside triphosphate hydrolase protein n=1 Tax=Rhypophila decipiens TaxID=261697 RepID=A0AAN7BBN5_9PEZI|nr:P-loop containing nucleoside triphosphate hydrolase protein [Rhypophila decipiens]
MKSMEFKVRKLQTNTDTEKRLAKKQPSRVYVNEDILIELTGSRDGGKAVCIEKASPSQGSGQPPVKHEATLWKAPEKVDKSVAQLYETFREVCDYNFGERVRVTALGGPLPDASEVVFDEITVAKPGQDLVVSYDTLAKTPQDIPHWEWALAGRLGQIEHVHAGLIFKNLYLNGPERSFVVSSVNGRTTGNARFLAKKTKVTISQKAGTEDESQMPKGELKVTGIRGLDSEIRKLNNHLSYFTCKLALKSRASYRGLVIHGGHGTGKTLLLNTIANAGWGTVYWIQFKDKLSEIQEVFQAARAQQPSIIMLDRFERLIDKERNNRLAVIQAICEGFDALAAEKQATGKIPQVVIIAACQDYIADMPQDLREPGRFTSDIYLPLPDVAARKEILASFDLSVSPEEAPDLLSTLAERTHAYNGNDLRRLVDTAMDIGQFRLEKEQESTTITANLELSTPSVGVEDEVKFNMERESESAEDPGPTATRPLYYYSPSDYTSALQTVRPSAMHDINLKPPPIRWSDIGGQDSVKKSLRRAVRLSTEKPEILSHFFDRPPKGFLLYGPPGCSKTMAAQAMATESGLNFFAVKGAELLNMYVGESERAVRRLFQRAREVAPSMIFFDEIDAIAGQRHGFGHGGGTGTSSSGGTSHGGLNVLTTLLNEMDGFEALSGVVVLAATNRPQALDPALLRPGRFDDLIYVSPPDHDARKAIFEGVAAKRKMARDVDVEVLAGLTEGYSGAEIKGICAAAGTAAYDRYMARTGEGLEGEEEMEMGVNMDDLEHAIRNMKKQITREMILGFENWEKQFRKQ